MVDYILWQVIDHTDSAHTHSSPCHDWFHCRVSHGVCTKKPIIVRPQRVFLAGQSIVRQRYSLMHTANSLSLTDCNRDHHANYAEDNRKQLHSKFPKYTSLHQRITNFFFVSPMYISEISY